MPHTVLVVESHTGIRTALAARLTQAPEAWVVRTASTLEAAVQAVQEAAPGVILCDPTSLSLREDAPAVVQRLSARGVPVVVLTPTLRAGEEQALRLAGAKAVLLQGLPLPAVRQWLLTAMASAAADADLPQRAAGEGPTVGRGPTGERPR